MNKPVLFRQYRTLDAVLIGGCLAIVGFIVWSLVFRQINQAQLAILAGLAGTVLGVLTGYAAARFGTPSSRPSNEPATVTTTAPADTTQTTVTPAA